MQGNVLLLLLILVPIILAPAAYLLGKKRDFFRQIFSFIAIGFVLGISLYLFITYNANNIQVCKVKTLYPLSLELDGFRAIHALLASFLWGITALFSKEYFKVTKDQKQPQYTAFNLLTLGAVLGVFLSANLFTLFVFFEIMSFTSYGWVIHDDTPTAKKAGGTYLAVSIIAGMVMLMGL
ncbi:MAG: sodium:proton antiporter, partial [Oscillospiraceae bacterium]